jgi:hypothetical protein
MFCINHAIWNRFSENRDLRIQRWSGHLFRSLSHENRTRDKFSCQLYPVTLRVRRSMHWRAVQMEKFEWELFVSQELERFMIPPFFSLMRVMEMNNSDFLFGSSNWHQDGKGILEQLNVESGMCRSDENIFTQSKCGKAKKCQLFSLKERVSWVTEC